MDKKDPSNARFRTDGGGGISVSIKSDPGKERIERIRSRRSTRSPSGDELEDHVTREDFDDFTIAFLEREEDYRYGWGSFTPDCIQWCCTPQFLLASLILIAFSQGFFVHGILVSCWSSLHGRFHFTMVDLALIRVMYDIGLAVGFIPVAYYNARGAKRSTWIGISCLVMAIGALSCAIPQFFIDYNDTRGWELGKIQDVCPRFEFNQSDANVLALKDLKMAILNWTPEHSSLDIETSETSTTEPTTIKSTTTMPTTTKLTTTTTTTTKPTTTTRSTTSTSTKSTSTTTSTSKSTRAKTAARMTSVDTRSGFDNSTTNHTHYNETLENVARRCKEAKILKHWKYAFMVGVFLNGLGAAAYFTMGIAFLDESVTHRASVIYTGTLNAVLLFGACAGLLFNAQVLRNVYTDFIWGIDPPDGMNNNHTRWRGAWWLGMLVAAVLSFLASLPMFGFPKQLPGAMKAHVEDAADLDDHFNEEKEKEKDRLAVAHSLWKSIQVCLTNLTYLGLTMEQIICWATITSFSTFMPEYLHTIYNITGWNGRFMPGIIVFSALIGSVIGTVIQHRFHLGVLGNLRFALATAVATLLFLGGMFIRCIEGEFAGWTISYPVNNSFMDQPNASAAACNQHCVDKCSMEDFHDFCYRGRHPMYPKRGKMILGYFSPCYASCAFSNSSGGYDCSCVPKDGSYFEGGGNIEYVSCGSKNCLYLAGAATVLFCWCSFLLFVRMNPLQHSFLRCIPFKDRVVGLSLSALLARLLGAVPAPLIIGDVLYKSCDVWEEQCENRVECRWRNEWNVMMRIGTGAYTICFVGIIGLMIAYYDQWVLSKMPKTTTRSGTQSIRPNMNEKKATVPESYTGTGSDDLDDWKNRSQKEKPSSL